MLLRRVVEFRGGDIEGDEDFLAELVAGFLHRRGDGLERIVGALEVRREAAFVADRGREAAAFEHALERVENLAAGAERFGKGRHAFRHDHELLEIDRRIGVRAAVDDVHHRHREHLGVRSAEIFEERNAELRGGRLRVGERDGEDGVGAELGFVRRAVERRIALSTPT